jgi:hypothetical protein
MQKGKPLQESKKLRGSKKLQSKLLQESEKLQRVSSWLKEAVNCKKGKRRENSVGWKSAAADEAEGCKKRRNQNHAGTYSYTPQSDRVR